MQVLDAAAVRRGLDPAALVEALRAVFAGGAVVAPERAHLGLGPPEEATLLLMPAWEGGDAGEWLGVKVATHHPGNGARGLPAIHGTYLLLDRPTGRPVAVLDGTELTRWRTAAASALAADHLAPATVDEHLLIGAGNVAAAIPACYAAVRDVGLTRVWARDPARARRLVDQLTAEGYAAAPAPDLRAAVRRADVVTTATSSTTPLVLGEDVRPGTHVDLIGSFSPTMVEADAALIAAARVVVDVPEARHTSGDLTGPLASGAITADHLALTLADLAAGRDQGRRSADEITVFESVGTAAEDLVAAALVWRRHTATPV